MDSVTLQLDTKGRTFSDLSEDLRSFCRDKSDGLCSVFVPHATAGLAVIETGAGSEEDLDALIERILPSDSRYVHQHGHAGHGRDHVIPALISPSLTIPVRNGQPQLGIWQHVVLVDTNSDNSNRQVHFDFLASS